ncbi:hypothetical protein [Phreatobacter sp. AB_2022a]|uniref:hypothetical protein n=1 Tax=Phreatobacter sp. AB_2022a TaxID=3003134 RepID=UPI00057036DD|nr:hypothetical protein [Phreatobacter sp. AB_2022a]MCZ0735989.1 hypothetical protein [Phreatobacter sp. AB_2022a]CEJ15562.1 hypothetical protein BN1110_05907 [bacterium YEK0313]
MNLAPGQKQRALELYEAQVVPDHAAVMPQLVSLFGPHTFFVNDAGLSIVEPFEADGAEREAVQVVRLARWGDDEHTSLIPHAPERTDTVLQLALNS